MADRIAVLRLGRLEQFGTPMELFERPANEFVATFIGSPRMNIYDAMAVSAGAEGATFQLASGQTLTAAVAADAVRPGEAVRVGIRPAHFDECENDDGLPFEVDYAEALGTETFLYGKLQGHSGQTIVHRPRHETPDRVLHLSAAPENVHVFRADTGVAVPRIGEAGK